MSRRARVKGGRRAIMTTTTTLRRDSVLPHRARAGAAIAFKYWTRRDGLFIDARPCLLVFIVRLNARERYIFQGTSGVICGYGGALSFNVDVLWCTYMYTRVGLNNATKELCS